MRAGKSFRSAFSPSRLRKKSFFIGFSIVMYLAWSAQQQVTSAKGTSFTFEMANGTCTENITTDTACHSWVMLNGTSLYNKGVLGFFYGLFLIYLFLGTAIVADIFMGAIEVITRLGYLKLLFSFLDFCDWEDLVVLFWLQNCLNIG